ncbi:hypothetical protein BSKO_06087 [Bryopsis sp. KO-2023]|nr:hypothetical protein BSKO_06087 [Bryopsis sp. KO-2023]
MDGKEAGDDPIVFAPISGEDAEGPMKVESLCVNCEENGTTTMLFTSIPHFKEVILMAFECPHCGFRNNEIQSAGQIGEKGVRLTLKVDEGALDVLSRQVVKADSATLRVPELDFEIPANTQKGQLSTVEGILRQSAENLMALQEVRRHMDPEAAEKIEEFCSKLNRCAEGEMGFTVVLDDFSGNSFIETDGSTVENDPLMEVKRYERTVEQCRALGLAVKEEEERIDTIEEEPEIRPDDPYHGVNAMGTGATRRAFAKLEGDVSNSALLSRYAAPEEVMVLPGVCLACGREADTKMFPMTIPFFKEVIIMANACDFCGYKNSEVRPGGGVSELGRSVILKVEEPEDLRRDVIKSDSASIIVPEIELEVTTGSLGSLITTVEGMVERVKTELEGLLSFKLGDSAEQTTRGTFADFIKKIDQCVALEFPWTLILSDPLANSFIAPIDEDFSLDERLKFEDFERSAETEEDLGITHLKVNQGVGEVVS